MSICITRHRSHRGHYPRTKASLSLQFVLFPSTPQAIHHRRDPHKSFAKSMLLAT